MYMPGGKPNKRYSGEFKIKVIEHMRSEHLSYSETSRLYDINSHYRIQQWERIYLEAGPEGLKIERRGKGSKGGPGRPPKLDAQAEADLIAEVQRLRMENDYLKKLNALVQERERRERKPK